MGTMIAMVVCYILLGIIMLAIVAGMGYAGVMAALFALADYQDAHIVGKVFVAVVGFVFGAVCPFWWAFCLAALAN